MKLKSCHKISLLGLVSTALMVTAACSPTIRERRFQDPKRNFVPRYEDTDVRERYTQPWDFNFNRIVVLDGNYSMAETLRLAENLFALQTLTSDGDLGAAGRRLLAKLQSLQGVRQETPIQQTPYAQLAIAKTESSVVAELKDVDSQIVNGDRKSVV